jgi:Flp pilus assembly pilin Flp
MRELVVALIAAAQARHTPSPDRGATAVEYALMAALIAGVIFATVGLLGGAVVGLYQGALDLMP